MSMQRFPDRQAIDAAESLTFEPQPVKMVVHAEQDGWPIDVELTIGLDKLPAALARLTRAGLTPRQIAAVPSGQKPARARQERIEPIYTPSGDPCCPTHKRPLKQGQYGLYCSAKDDGPDSKNGYCGLKFAE